jgi:hypothetical protein
MRRISWSVLEFLAILIFSGACLKNEPVTPALPTNLCTPSYITGYTDKISYYPGDVVTAFLQSKDNVAACRLDIYRITGGVVFSVSSPMTIQKIVDTDPSANGFGFVPTVQFTLPKDLKSGIYQIENQSPFVVKTRNAVDVLVIYPSNTSNAYCDSGGKSLYTVADKPSFVSFLRPIPVSQQAIVGLQWFSQQKDLNIGFVADVDLDDYATIRNTKIISVVGHSEYWTRRARENFDRFVNEGGHALVLSGNTMWWQVRYSTGLDKMIRYLGNDPEPNTLLRTINWHEASLQYPILYSIGADFPHGGYGLKVDKGWNGYKITNPTSPLLEGTSLQKGDILTLPSGEYDGAPITGFDADGYPMLNLDSLQFSKVELVGFDRGSRFDKETIGTFIVFQRTPSSGIVINTASYDWCSASGMGGVDGLRIQKITRNAIDKLLGGKPVFSK